MCNKLINYLTLGSGAIMGYLFGGCDALFGSLCCIIVVDTITGILKAYNEGNYSSSAFKKGLFTKCGYFLALMVIVQLDKLGGNTGVFRGAMLVFTIKNEIASIFENLKIMGVKIPQEITKALEVGKEDTKFDNKNK